MPVYKEYNGKPVVGYSAEERGYDNLPPGPQFWYYQNPDGTDGKPLDLEDENDMLGRMGYKKASELRKKSFGTRMAENLISGGGIGASFKKTLSEKSKARMMGIKESFDPLNMVKKLTGGSKLAPAVLGKMLGRSKQDLEYFSGDPRRRKLDTKATAGFDEETLQKSTESLGNIYNLLKKDRDNKIKQRQKKENFEESLDKQEELRNQELIKALTARRKKKEPTKKEEEKEKPKKAAPEKPAAGKAPSVPKKGAPKKAPTKPAEAPKKAPTKPAEAPKKAPTKPAEVPKPPTKSPEVPKPAPKPPAKETPKPVPEKPTAAPVPKPTEVKPPTAKPVTKPKAKPPTAKPEPKLEAKPPTAGKIPPVTTSGTKGLVLGALVAAGYSTKTQANIMANVEKESNFNPRNEEIPKSEKIFSMFGGPEVGKTKDGRSLNKSGNVIRFPTMEDAKAIVAAGPEAYFNKVYDGRMGNTSPGDGYKYRGRGFIQITGKDMYIRVGKLIGEDLVGNPDLANKPEIAAKIVPAFFQLKMKERKLKLEDFENIDVVNTTVGGADMQSREQRKVLAAAYANELNTGNQIDSVSKENKDLKATNEKDRPANIVNNNTVIQNPGEPPKKKTEKVDDRPAPIKKQQG